MEMTDFQDGENIDGIFLNLIYRSSA